MRKMLMDSGGSRINEDDGHVIGMDQTRQVVQSASLIEEQSEMGHLEGVNDSKFFNPDARDGSQNKGGNLG
uniref:Uncharacterized protein n=1 Tax=Romanomermis culicivorax TaxID=13658 RepID=A0A915HS03_ROMCU